MANTDEEMSVSFGIHDALLEQFSLCLVSLSNDDSRVEKNIA